MNAQHNSSIGKKRKRKRGERKDNNLKHYYRHMNRNITECLNEYLKANNKEQLVFVQLPKEYLRDKEPKASLSDKEQKASLSEEEQKPSLYKNFRLKEINKSVIDFLCKQPEIKDFLNKTFKEVYNTYYTEKKKSNELQKLPFTTNKFVSIEELIKKEEKQLQQLNGVLEDENWKKNEKLSEDYFNKIKTVLQQKFVLSIQQEINDILYDLQYKGKKLWKATTVREFFKKDTKIKDFWNRETRNTENMGEIIDNIMRYEPIKDILETTLGERLKEYCNNKIPKDEIKKEESCKNEIPNDVTTISEKEESCKNEIPNDVNETEEEKEGKTFCNHSSNIGENDISGILNNMITNTTQCETMKDKGINLNSNHELPGGGLAKEINSDQNSETFSKELNYSSLLFESEREDK